MPLDDTSAMSRKVREPEGCCGVVIPTACHAGDGDLHPALAFPGAEVPGALREAAGELFEHTPELGARRPGEHGTGLLERRWSSQELGGDQLDTHRQIKSVLDPAGILDPDEVFAPTP